MVMTFNVGDPVRTSPATPTKPSKTGLVTEVIHGAGTGMHSGHTVIYRVSGTDGTWDSDHLTLVAPVSQPNTIADLDAAYQDGYAYRSSVANFRNPYTEQLQDLREDKSASTDNEWRRLYALAVAFNKGHEQWKLEQKILKELRTLSRTRQPQKDAKPSSKRTKKATKRG